MRLAKRFFPLFLIVLLACSLLAVNFTPTVKAAIIFSDNFESGNLAAWTGSAGGTSVVTSPVHHGTYAGKLPSSAAALWKSIAANNILYARCYFNTSGALPALGKWGAIFALQDSASKYLSLGYSNNGGTLQLWLDYSGTSVNYNYTMPLNTWICLEILFDATNDVHKGWLNGVQVLTLNKAIATTTAYLSMGVNSGGTWSAPFYFDCVVVADAYIGPETTGTNYNIDLSLATTMTYTLTSQWQTTNTLTLQTPETYTTTQQWNTKTTITLSTPLSWTTASQTAYNLALPFTQGFTWLIDLTISHGGVLHIVDLLWSSPLSYVFSTQTTYNLAASLLHGFSWIVGTQTNYLVTASWSMPQTWTLQAWTGLSYILDLAWTSGFTWAIDFLNTPLAALDVLGVAAIAFIIALTALGLAALVMLKRRET